MLTIEGMRLPGYVLREVREGLGVLQREAAERLGVTQASFSRWEHGHVPPNRIDQIAELFGIDRSDFEDKMQEIEIDDDHIANVAVKLMEEDLDLPTIVRRLGNEFAIPHNRVLQALTKSPVVALRIVSAKATPGGFVASAVDVTRWRDALSADDVELMERALLFTLPMFLDKVSWVSSFQKGDIVERAKVKPDLLDSRWDAILSSPYVERVGTGEFCFRLKFPE